jgi:threonylcarbamoyladenosine tRNA methylthiotransferase MtaB
MKISFLTYGCKVNQYETELIRQMFLKTGGFEEAASADDAEVCLVNTCTVTGKIDNEITRRLKQLKAKTGMKVILTGCLVERRELEKNSLPVDWIIPNTEKFNLSAYPREIIKTPSAVYESVLEGFSGRNKAFVKVEDGCDRFCAYCTVPLVRGSSIRSRSGDEIIKEIGKLTDGGFREIILTGVNLGLFGKEKGEKNALLDLLLKITGMQGDFRVRLSSISPADLPDKVISIAANNPNRICPHFHLSLQSGDDAVLKRMNRNYDAALYRQKVKYITERIKFPGITTDVIAGFPGETEEEFANTAVFIKELPFTRLHVFPYSDRPGTKASAMGAKLSDEVKKFRVKKLLAIAAEKEYAFAAANKGRTLKALIEDPSKAGFLFGYTENYIRVSIKDTPDTRKLSNTIADVRITGVFKDEVTAEVV